MLFTPKVAFWKAWMKNKVFGNQIKEEKLEIFASVPYRSNTGKGKERIWERYRQKEEELENLSDFQQIQVKFYQLFATVLRWSLENLKRNYQTYRSFDEREEGRKEEKCLTNKQTNKVNFKNEGKQVFLPGLLKSVPYRSITGRLEKDMPDMCVQLNKQTNKILKWPAKT